MNTNTKGSKPTPVRKSTARKTPVKKATPKKATPKKVAAPKVDEIASVIAANHEQWRVVKKGLTESMAALLYDSRRVSPAHAKSREEASAKVSAALKVLAEFSESVRIKS